MFSVVIKLIAGMTFLFGVGRGEKGRAKPSNYLLCTEDMQSTLRQLRKEGLCVLAGGMLCNHLMKICKYQEKQITLPWGKKGGREGVKHNCYYCCAVVKKKTTTTLPDESILSLN